MIGLNCGSGQRPFKSTGDWYWLNLDIQAKWNPDIVADWHDLSMFEDGSVDCVVAHQTIEHGREGCGSADGFFREAYRVLKPNGSLLIFIPDLRALAEAWITRKISDHIYVVNLMGSYNGDEADRHYWHWTRETLTENLKACAPWSTIRPFNWREIPGMDAANDFWVLSAEAIK